ncbi:hypothetical protein [Leptothrix discophora]|uniref:Transmembrane protein n=1 Tax=Leptothrix discophora TaxID=89 RepID=A0ABT9G243_LEPDI|nr:hypothetical protein [Leptothrix discophora]MDP4300554.1 hypothetical protein [Leptothrix discophora]
MSQYDKRAKPRLRDFRVTILIIISGALLYAHDYWFATLNPPPNLAELDVYKFEVVSQRDLNPQLKVRLENEVMMTMEFPTLSLKPASYGGIPMKAQRDLVGKKCIAQGRALIGNSGNRHQVFSLACNNKIILTYEAALSNYTNSHRNHRNPTIWFSCTFFVAAIFMFAEWIRFHRINKGDMK